MNKKQRDAIKTIYKKLGSSKTKLVVEKIRNHPQKISLAQIQEWTKLNPQHSKEFVALMNSFGCNDSVCIALEMQDEIESQKIKHDVATKLIITSPITGKGVGHTFSNFRKIIETAKSEIIVIGYVFMNIQGQMNPIIESLMSAMERGISIKIFFEKGESARSLASIWQKSKFYKAPELYVYKKKTSNSVLHAKAIIKDEDVILVTSANMTGSAMETNVEFGILHEGELAMNAKKILCGLIDRGYMVKAN